MTAYFNALIRFKTTEYSFGYIALIASKCSSNTSRTPSNGASFTAKTNSEPAKEYSLTTRRSSWFRLFLTVYNNANFSTAE